VQALVGALVIDLEEPTGRRSVGAIGARVDVEVDQVAPRARDADGDDRARVADERARDRTGNA